MFKSIGAVLLTWLVSMIAWMLLMTALLAAAAALDPAHFQFPPTGEAPNPPNKLFWFASLGIDGIMGAVAGLLVCRWSPSRPKAHLIALMIFFCAGTIATAFGEAGLIPEWVSWGRVVLVSLTLFAGGHFQMSKEKPSNPLESMVTLQA